MKDKTNYQTIFKKKQLQTILKFSNSQKQVKMIKIFHPIK